VSGCETCQQPGGKKDCPVHGDTVELGRPRLLDLCCCSGGLAKGYHDAGFDVDGVDIDPQPNFPYTFHQGDAVEFVKEHGHEYDAFHGSAPCQNDSPLNAYNHKEYPRLIEPLREAFNATGKPWVMENVPQAPLRDPVILCGKSLGLKMYRHRAFEAGGGFRLVAPRHLDHVERCARNGYLPTVETPFMSIHGGKHSWAWLDAAAGAMGMPWIHRDARTAGESSTEARKRLIREVCEAVPPAYGRWVGAQLIAHLIARAAA